MINKGKQVDQAFWSFFTNTWQPWLTTFNIDFKYSYVKLMFVCMQFSRLCIKVWDSASNTEAEQVMDLLMGKEIFPEMLTLSRSQWGDSIRRYIRLLDRDFASTFTESCKGSRLTSVDERNRKTRARVSLKGLFWLSAPSRFTFTSRRVRTRGIDNRGSNCHPI